MGLQSTFPPLGGSLADFLTKFVFKNVADFLYNIISKLNYKDYSLR